MTPPLTTSDLDDAIDLARRIARDPGGAWHVSDAFQSIVRDDRRALVCITDGDLFGGRDFERDAEDIVAARRLVPVLLAEVERLGSLIATMNEEEPSRRCEVSHTLNSAERCECCGGVLAAGSEVAFIDEDAFAHWGPCPSPSTWVVHWSDTAGADRYAMPLPYEDAFVLGTRTRSLPHVKRVWLTRFATAGRCTEVVSRASNDGTYRLDRCGRAVVSGDRCERHPEVGRGR